MTFGTAVAQAELEEREQPGVYHRLRFSAADGTAIEVDTTRPELLPACVALVCHPDDVRYSSLVGGLARTPLFKAEVPVYAHPLADPTKGTGIAMVCTFGDLTDVTWWRDLRLDTRVIVGRDGRLLPDAPDAIDATAYAELAGRTVKQARNRVVDLLRKSGDLIGEPKSITHPVKFYEKGSLPLEIVSSRQWYIRNGGRDQALREELLEAGRELRWVPVHMRHRYEHWVSGLTGDWLISRQRFFGVPFPVWYRLDADGTPDYAHPLVPDEGDLPVDPSSDAPAGYPEAQRGQRGGFIADPDVMDTWATSSLSPQIAGGWEHDPDLFARVFPMDLRPQAHEIIRTWLFATVVRARAEHGQLPWHTADISGWIVAKPNEKFSKSKGNSTTGPNEMLDKYGADAVRYWSASGRPGVDTAFDEGQMKVGRRLATKLLNASRFVLGFTGASASLADVTQPLDRAVLTQLSTVVRSVTESLESSDHTGALTTTEAFFWEFCDDYIELVKERAYGPGPTSSGPRSRATKERVTREGGVFGAQDPRERSERQKHGPGQSAASARAALAIALDVQLRLFAPFLPYVTEEIWSWFRSGSVHRARWPEPAELTVDGEAEVLAVTATALGGVRRAKSGRSLSMRAEVARVVIAAPAAVLEHLAQAESDLKAAGRIASLDLVEASGDLAVACEFSPS